ncbi:MAG: LamG-like jellyroll fold domain-containing protein [Mycobacteriales bacterium]
MSPSRSRSSRSSRSLVAAMVALLAAATVAALPGPAHGAAAPAFTVESVRAVTWNICGEAGGPVPTPADPSPAYCPYRNQPQVKADAVANVIAVRRLNAVILEETCWGAPGSLIDLLQQDLGPAWQFTTAEMKRPDGTSNCRGGLTGTLGIAIGVKGQLGEQSRTTLPVPNPGYGQNDVLCTSVVGWQTEVCGTHLSNDPGAPYADEVETVRSVVSRYPRVVLGGDFNTSVRTKLQPLYDLFGECDAQVYYPGEASNEVTHFTYAPTASDTGHYTSTKIDYLFATAGFTNCDSWTQLADQADYGQTQTPTGYSDHAPLYGYTRGAAGLAWGLRDGAGTSAADSSGNGQTGTLNGDVTWTAERGGAAAFGGAGAITCPTVVLDTSHSFTVSAWVKVDPGAATGAVASQDGSRASGFILWYNVDGTWRFGMPTADADGWSVDQAPAGHAQTGVWTHLAGTFDAVKGTVSLYVDGGLVGSHPHTARWRATGPFAVGRDLLSGNANAFLHGQVDDVAIYDYSMTAAEIAALYTSEHSAD